MSDQDILEAMQKTGSQRRYRPVGNVYTHTSVAPLDGTRKPIQRANRTADLPVVEPTTRVPQPPAQIVPTTRPVPVLKQEPRRTTQASQERRPLLDVDTDADVEIAQTVRPRSAHAAAPTRQLPPLQSSRRQLHWVVILGMGMAAMLALWLLAVQVMVAWTNTVHDPGYYTQTAHLDVVMVKIDAHNESQVRAFLDPQSHLDLFVLPVSDSSKAHVVVGPTLTTVTDLRHTTIIVTVHDTIVTVTIQGPLEANYLSTMRQSSAWSIDLKKTGGH